MSRTGAEEPKHFSQTEKIVKAISVSGSQLIYHHFQGKIDLEGCVEISADPPPLMLIFDTPQAARHACWLLESLARLPDKAHIEHEISLLINIRR